MAWRFVTQKMVFCRISGALARHIYTYDHMFKVANTLG